MFRKITAIATQHYVGERGGINGQARRAKRDHNDELEGKKGECVNNFVADWGQFLKKLWSCVSESIARKFGFVN